MAVFTQIPVSPDDAGQRIDRFIKKYFSEISLSRIHGLFRKKEIKVNKRPVKKNYLLQPGDTIICFGLQKKSLDPGAVARPPAPGILAEIPVVFEDAQLLVINKPAGVAVHPGTGIEPGKTVVGWLEQKYPQAPGTLFKPSLVHRLDKDTSGLLMIAKTGEALRWWTARFRERKMIKFYWTLVPGHMPAPSGILDKPLKRVSSQFGGSKSEVDTPEGKTAKTEYRVVDSWEGFSFLEIRLYTGRMHQIRAHLQAEGRALLGDTRYGDFALNREVRKKLGLKRLFLHAFYLEGQGPDGALLQWKTPLPPDLENCLQVIKNQARANP